MAELDPSTPLVVDARDGLALAVIAGIPLVCRTVRLLARAGWREVVVLGEPAALERAFAWRPPPPSATLRLEARAPRPGEQVVDGRTVFVGPELETLTTLSSATELPAAERRLYESLRKRIEGDGVVAYYVARPLTRGLVRALLGTRVAPNHVTFVAMACGVAAAVLAATGGVAGAAAAGVILWLGQAVDCVDGDIARLRVEGSKTGEWLDSLADDVSTLAMLLGLGIGLAVPPWPALGVVGFVVGSLTMAKIYWDLHRMGATIDAAQYPWFFGKPSDGVRPEGKGKLGRLVSAFAYLFRRDAYVTILTVLLLFGARVPAFVILFGGTTLCALLLVLTLLMTKPPQ